MILDRITGALVLFAAFAMFINEAMEDIIRRPDWSGVFFAVRSLGAGSLACASIARDRLS